MSFFRLKNTVNKLTCLWKVEENDNLNLLIILRITIMHVVMSTTAIVNVPIVWHRKNYLFVHDQWLPFGDHVPIEIWILYSQEWIWSQLMFSWEFQVSGQTVDKKNTIVSIITSSLDITIVQWPPSSLEDLKISKLIIMTPLINIELKLSFVQRDIWNCSI